ncbi:hypothetical protein WKV52_10130 [Tetragenococcus halophilus]|uniref:hypothetical protein n=1 Tax=Tetragenococcus halophilus TaxID=51669 RepID=UPI00300FA817
MSEEQEIRYLKSKHQRLVKKYNKWGPTAFIFIIATLILTIIFAKADSTFFSVGFGALFVSTTNLLIKMVYDMEIALDEVEATLDGYGYNETYDRHYYFFKKRKKESKR